MSLVRTAFLGTPDIAAHCLRSLYNDDHFEVVGVVTQPDRPAGRNMKLQASPVSQLATELGLPVLTPENINDESVLSQIKSWRPEVLVVVAYGQILRKSILEKFPQRIVNIHASLLPRWRGAAPIQRAIMAGDESTGVSLQIVRPKLDSGEVLGVRKIDIHNLDSLELLEKMKFLASDLLEIELMDFVRGNLTPHPQDESLVTIAPKLDKSEAEIDWTLPAHVIERNIRGLKMGPGSFSSWHGKKVKIHKAEVVDARGEPGVVVKAKGEDLVIACGERGLKILDLQPESRAQMPTKGFLQGHDIKVGEKWG